MILGNHDPARFIARVQVFMIGLDLLDDFRQPRSCPIYCESSGVHDRAQFQAYMILDLPNIFRHT